MGFWTAIKDFLSGFANDGQTNGRPVNSEDCAADVVGKETCATCGSSNLKKNGVETKTPNPYQRYRCLDCGSALRGTDGASCIGALLVWRGRGGWGSIADSNDVHISLFCAQR